VNGRVRTVAAADLKRNSPVATLRGEMVDSKEGAERSQRYRLQV
jgi:hypothetical protein